MKAAAVRAETRDELIERLGDLKKEQFNLRFQRASGQLENTARVREVRRDVARIKTILTEKPRGGTAAATAPDKPRKQSRARRLLSRIRGAKKNA